MDNVTSNAGQNQSSQNKNDPKVDRRLSVAENLIQSFGNNIKNLFDRQNKQRLIEPIRGTSFVYKRQDVDLEKVKIAKKGEIIVDQFFDTQGNEIGREVVTRIKTVDVYKKQLHTELEYLQKAQYDNIYDQNTVHLRIQQVEKKIKYANLMIADWASTNSGRHIFSKLSEEEAREIGVPVLPNLRQHQTQFEETGSSMNRSGAITDLGHGETNLMEIVDFEYLTNLEPDEKPLEIKVRHFKNYYGVDINDQNARLELWVTLKWNIIKAYGSQQISQIKDIEQDRRGILQRQALQDLLVHFQTKPADQQQICYSRVAFLDPTKPPETDKETHYHNNERNQLLDMKAIYDELDGAELVFNLQTSEGPYIDLEGRIHMPKECCQEQLHEGVPITLNTILVNCSVQNNQKNEGLQNFVNQEAMEKIRSLPLDEKQRERFEDLNNTIMNSKKTDFELAHQVVDFLKDFSYTSADCYGGKDRTGYAMALETYHAIRSVMRKKANANPAINKNYSKIMAHFREQLVGPRGVAVRVAEDNTGCRALKISEFMLKLYVSGRGLFLLRGLSKRLSDYLMAAKLFMPEPLVVHPTMHNDSILFDNEEEIEALRKQKAA